MQDYGGPVGFRLAMAHPERVQALVIQNAVAHEEGLGPLWEIRRAYWRDRGAYEEKLRANLASLEATKQRHLGTSPHPQRYDPDSWTDEYAFLSRPGEAAIQSDLFYDYRTNVDSYPLCICASISRRRSCSGANTIRRSPSMERPLMAETYPMPKFISSTPAISPWTKN
jgi:pimeloyl-ACP methyl ester carboxylesterase